MGAWVQCCKEAAIFPNQSYDEIRCKILKICASLISHPLSYIYNFLLYAGIFFRDCPKVAVIKPLYKKGDKTLTNYRHISLLTVFSEVFKKTMHSRLSQNVPANNIFVTEQYGFRKGIATENDVFRLTDSILKAVKKKSWRNFM